ncbi:hypothetical protein IFR04_004030 [Cadophora malorum]|uniref:Uncharacterized protein n=1 Tax=Cadophora malorum TaxID=108018 RepID=A0A8H7WDL5_9HELO|nr:hypothetical protein IFR04_004030 [Cadophora malorum]
MVGKVMEFEATRPVFVDGRHSASSPTVLALLLRKFNPMNPEDMIELAIKNNKGIFHDICLWCERTGNPLITSEHTSEDEDIHCIIQKGERRSSDQKMVVVMSSANLEVIVEVLEKAIGGCVLGMDVSLFFEGTGVRLLQNGYRARCPGIFGGFRTNKIEGECRRVGKLLPRDAIGMLEELGANFFVCGPSLEIYGVDEEEVSVAKYEVVSGVRLTDLLTQSDVNLFSGGVFERP